MIGWATLRSIALLGIEPRHSPTEWLGQLAELRILRKMPGDWRGALHDLDRFSQLVLMVRPRLRDIDNVAVERTLGQARDHNGGWARPGPELETTAVALRIAAYCQSDFLRDAAVSDFLTHCEDETLGFRISPSGRATSVDALWGGLEIARALGRSPAYPQSIARSILLLQRPDGGLGARHRSISTLQATWRGLEASDMLLAKA